MNYRLLLISLMGIVFLTACMNQSKSFDASGVFEATEIIVSSEASGKIIQFAVEEGETLTANQVVGQVDDVQLVLRKKQLLANVGVVQSRRPDIKKQIAAIEQQILATQKEKKRIGNLLKANAATPKQWDDITAQVTILEKQLDAQKSTLASTTKGLGEESSALSIQVDQLDDQIQKCQIINPIDGIVLTKYAEQSEITMPGKALYKIANIQNMILRAYITSSQLTQIKLGQTVQVIADFGTKETKAYPGKIIWISSKSEFTPKTIQTKDERANLVYAIKIAVQNDGYLKIGMYGGVQFRPL